MKTKILLAANAVLLALLVLTLASDGGATPAWASGPGASTQNLLAVTAQNRGGFETLYLVDTETKQLLAYEMRPQGLAFVGARRLTHDLKVTAYKDSSEKGVRFVDLQEKFAPRLKPAPAR